MFKAPSTSDNATQSTQNTQNAVQELRELPVGAVLPSPDQPSQQDRTEQARDPEQPQDPTEQAQEQAALNLARAWGDLLGAEVHVRPMRRQKMRLEVSFDFATEGIALADRLAAAIARGSKGR